jgi:hypothetical protein
VPPTIDPRLLILVCAVLETGTGLALLTLPRLVLRVLLGVEPAGAGVSASRLCGLGLLCLGLACWPEWKPRPHHPDRRAIRALLVFHASASAYLAVLMALDGYHGIALGPAIVLHAVLAALLVRIAVWSKTVEEGG